MLKRIKRATFPEGFNVTAEKLRLIQAKTGKTYGRTPIKTIKQIASIISVKFKNPAVSSRMISDGLIQHTAQILHDYNPNGNPKSFEGFVFWFFQKRAQTIVNSYKLHNKLLTAEDAKILRQKPADPRKMAIDKERTRLLQKAIQNLPSELGIIVGEYYFEGSTQEQIGKRHGFAKSTALRKLRKAREILRTGSYKKELEELI